jgi:hypothetical protein
LTHGGIEEESMLHIKRAAVMAAFPAFFLAGTIEEGMS